MSEDSHGDNVIDQNRRGRHESARRKIPTVSAGSSGRNARIKDGGSTG